MTNLATHMYDWVFHYNTYTEEWQAVRRDQINFLFTDRTKLLTSSSIATLIDIVNKTNGEQSLLKNLVDEDNG